MGSAKYLISMGELSRKDNSICFRVNNKNAYIPVENVSELYCLSEISLNSKLLDFLARNNIVVHFFNYYEGYSGSFYPKDNLVSGKLLIAQVKAYENKRMEIAKAFVCGIAENIDDTLYHYYKHNKKEVKETVDWIRKDFKKKVSEVDDIKQLM